MYSLVMIQLIERRGREVWLNIVLTLSLHVHPLHAQLNLCEDLLVSSGVLEGFSLLSY